MAASGRSLADRPTGIIGFSPKLPRTPVRRPCREGHVPAAPALIVLRIMRRTDTHPAIAGHLEGNLVQIPPVDTIDYHTGGEPFRIVAESPVPIPGNSVADRRDQAIVDPAVDRLQQVLCFEPRGHADMYGCFITPPDDAGADLGVLFWHKDGWIGPRVDPAPHRGWRSWPLVAL